MENIFTLQKRASLAKILRDAGTIGIIASARQNHDTMGAALALYLVLQQNKKNAQIVSAKDPLVEISDLYGINKVKQSFDSAIKQLTISFPFKEGEIEKAMYKTEGDKINVHFYAADNKTISFSEDNVKFIKKGGTPGVIFALAVSDDEIKEFTGDMSATIIRISRHPKDTTGEIVYTDKSFSSISEIVTKIVQEQGLSIDRDAAQNLLDGVMSSTNNFTHPRTSPLAFEATGFLLKRGAQRKEFQNDGKEFSQDKKQKNDSNEKSSKEGIIFDTKNDNKEKEVSKIEEPKEESQKTEKIETKDNHSQNPVNDGEIPSDWFEPKVFKSSKSN